MVYLTRYILLGEEEVKETHNHLKIIRNKTLNSKLVKQGFQLNSLTRKFESFALKYIHLWSKYGTDISSDDYLNSVFSS